MKEHRLGYLQSHSLLWMISGLLLWTLHFVAVYVLMSLGCALSFAATRVVNVYLINVVVVAVTVPLLLAILYLGLSSWRYWRQLQRDPDPEMRESTAGFMALTATLIHAISAVSVLWVTMPAFISHPC